jgi:hypothetical protein
MVRRNLMITNHISLYAIGMLMKHLHLLIVLLFFFYFVTFGDCFHCEREFIITFPSGLDKITSEQYNTLYGYSTELMHDMKRNAIRRRAQSQRTGRVEYDEFWSRPSKTIVDRIDRELAHHYNFTDEELDFIINYDIKYRMGRDDESEEE